jgi:hypothetical protein
MTVIINGTTGIDTVQDGIVTDDKLNLTANSQEIKDALNATGSAPIYACRAWVNFNGTGTVAIRASGNVSSITDNGTGYYTVNFTTSMPDANYSALGTAGHQVGATGSIFANIRTASGDEPTTSAYKIETRVSNTGTTADVSYVFSAAFR